MTKTKVFHSGVCWSKILNDSRNVYSKGNVDISISYKAFPQVKGFVTMS